MAQLKTTRRVLRLTFLLAGKEFDGMRPSEIAKAMGVSPATVTQDMADLEAEGYAERVPDRPEAWRLSPRLVQIAAAHQDALVRMELKASEIRQRYSRLPN